MRNTFCRTKLLINAAMSTFLMMGIVCGLLTLTGCNYGDKDDSAQVKIDEQAMMAAMVAHAQPGEHHKYMAQMAGEWNATVKYYMAPGEEPQVALAQSSNTLIFGGRYLKQKFVMDTADNQFNGIGYLGYDNAKQKYIMVWLDDTTSSIATSEGTCDGAGKVFTFFGDMYDAYTKTFYESKTVTRILDENTHVMEMYKADDKGQECMEMEIIYRRK